MEDAYDLLYKCGDRLILKLNTEQVFEGDYNTGGKHRLDLINVKQHHNKNELSGIYSFYRNEIMSISKLSSETEDKIDQNYFDSIEKLDEAETVGIACVGLDMPRLLAVSSWEEIYLFDLMSVKIGEFYPELKNILELKCFNFPPSLLKEAVTVTSKDWVDRPLNEEQMYLCSQLVAYLIPLKQYMKKILLSSVYKAIDDAHHLYYDHMDDYVFLSMVQRNEVPKELDDVIPLIPNSDI
ncbi:hypothetical protein NQ315_006010 [Exocentrus adspersus]|uniref:3'-5' exonuclease domain-containing protein n=1 Tax=Exocentrus adspersus TaxID=1586481 RepID=A0AAV8V763_9CUCU|nr:hypothetical protein NQ315_006010 [Exocentrus adspersus]